MAYEIKNGKATRIDPSTYNTSDYKYSQQAAFISDEAYHGGGDVPIYAIGNYQIIFINKKSQLRNRLFFLGPYAHLFHSTHEQNYVAHVIGYAAQIGPYANVANQLNRKWIVIITFSVLCVVYYCSNIYC